MRYNFNNKVIWITGASSGIGLALAKRMQSEGAYVVVSARNEEKLLSEFGYQSNALVAAGDLTDLDSNLSIVKAIQSSFGQLDCAILNAGYAEYIDTKNFSYKPFSRMMETNFLSMTKGVEAALPLLRKSEDPYLVGMSSSVAWQGLPQGQAYSASKAAIRNLFQGLNIELASEKIAVSWICPGFVKTPLTDKNNFDMPFRIEVEEAARIILKQLSQKKTEIHFPKRFTWFLRMISLLPASWQPGLLKGTVPQR